MAKILNRDLFGNPLDENLQAQENKPVLLLNSTSDNITKCFESISYHHTKVTLEKITVAIKDAFKFYSLRSKSNPSSPIPCIEKLYQSPRKKDDYTWPVAVVFGDDDNFREFYNTFPENIKRVWEQCYRQRYISVEQINKLAGEKVVIVDSSYYSRQSHIICNNLLAVFSISNYYFHYFRSMSSYIWMPQYLWDIYNRAIANNETHPLDDVPNDGNLLFYSNEQNIGEQLFMLQQMQEQETLELGAYKMQLSSIKKAAKQIGLKEFFPHSNTKELKQMAAQLMIPSLASFNLSKTGVDINRYWRIIQMFALSPNPRYIVMEWLSHLKAVKREHIFYNSRISQALGNTVDALKAMTPGKWLSCDNFDKLRRTIPDATSDTISVVNAKFVADNKTYFDYNQERLRVEDIYEHISTPVYKGCLFLFATYGLLDIAYRVPLPIEPRFNCLEFIRLTKLGEYVFGHVEEYDAPGIHKPTEYFKTDPERLIIRALYIDDKNPYETVLDNIADPIGSHRYRVTAKSFMKGCQGIEDINRKWEFFKQNIDNEPSQIWKEFHVDVLRHCHPLLNPGIGYTIKKIQPGDNELLHLLSTDSYIREHTLRAERNHILIETKCLEQVKVILRRHGYLI